MQTSPYSAVVHIPTQEWHSGHFIIAPQLSESAIWMHHSVRPSVRLFVRLSNAGVVLCQNGYTNRHTF